jgi:hypothetical protein
MSGYLVLQPVFKYIRYKLFLKKFDRLIAKGVFDSGDFPDVVSKHFTKWQRQQFYNMFPQSQPKQD